MRRENGRRPRAAAAAAAVVAVGVAMASHPLPRAAAFSTPTFTSRARPALAEAFAAVGAQGSASTSDGAPLGRGALHHSCRAPVMSVDDMIAADASRRRRVSAFYEGGALKQLQQRRLGSTSGQYGGLGGSSTSLSVSQSTNALGFQVEDFEPYNPNNSNNGEEEDTGDLPFSFEDFDSYLDDPSLEKSTGRPVIRTQNRRSASQTSQRVAASLLQNGSTTRLGRDLVNSSSRAARPANKSKSNSKSKLIGEEEDLPPWFPWIPTEKEINSLRVVELRAACAERGLVMTGKKADLQNRLLIWSTVQDRKRVKDRLTGLKDLIEKSKSKETLSEGYDVDALTNKRKALTKEKKRGRKGGNNRGVLGLVDESYFNATATADEEEEEEEDEMAEEDNSMVNEASISRLSQTFNAPSSYFTNREVREMYLEAKNADQAGDRARAKAILHQLRMATPHDMRVVRRLARMEQEDGHLSTARDMLQQALEAAPDNAHLLHGLGQLERTAGNDYTAKKYFRRASKKDPSFPNPYHALGTLEHTHGNVRAALAVIKEGIRHCPQNHRLYHALGDVYLDASMLDLAEESYLQGIQHAPQWSKPFFYTSLSFVSYAQGHTRDCRTLLRQSLTINGGMHAQGVIALAQLEESEGNVAEARKVYRDAISSYEKRRRKRSPVRSKPLEKENVFDTSSLVDGKGNHYTRSYAGDKWINVFRSWARMEEVHGTYETTHIVFSKAAMLFPTNVNLLVEWADLQAKHGDTEKARLLYEAACHRVGGRSAGPYRLFAEFEMKRKNFVAAQSILLRGAKAVSDPPTNDNKGNKGKDGLARLLHTWGVDEYHLGSHTRSEQLFDEALRVTGPEEEDSATRSLILYSMARLEFSRKEYLLAQHCIGLSLKENLLPGGNSLIWKLWSEIAEKMENDELAKRCKEQSLLLWEEERGGAVSDLSRLLGERPGGADHSKTVPSDREGRLLPQRTGSAMKDMFRKTPWYDKVNSRPATLDADWYRGAKLWDRE